MTRSLKVLPLAVIATLIASAACSSSSSGPAQGSATLTDNATVIDAASAADVIVMPDQLQFPAATHQDILQKVAGDILIGDEGAPASKNPTGFLRKIVSVSQQGDQIVVMTTAATLMEAVKQAQFQATLQVPALTADGPDTSGTSTSAFAMHPLATGGTTIKLLDFSGKTIFDKSGNATLASGHTIGYAAHATVKQGTLNFSPSFDVGADIEPDLSNLLGSIKEFHVIGTGKLDSTVELDVGMNLTGNPTGDDLAALIAQAITGSQSTTLADYPIDLGHISVGILSIPIHAEFKATLACDLVYGGGVAVDVGATASAQVSAGFKYDGSSVSPVFSHTESFDMIGPNYTADASVHAKCSVKPEFDLSFYDLAAGDVYAEGHVALTADADCSQSQLTGTISGSLQAGVMAAAHAKVDLLGLYTFEKTCTLFDVESPTEAVSESFTLPGGTNKTCTSNPPQSTTPTPDPDPASCFAGTDPGTGNGGTTGGNTGGVDGGGTNPGDDGGTGEGGTTTPNDGGPVVDGCVQNNDPPPSGWTCPASSYGDCVCSCNCGGTDIDCAPGACSTCNHDSCTIGDALGLSCTDDGQSGACIQSICENDSYCCTFAWTASCVAHVTNGDYACVAKTCP
jgi:hypothetical protein